jgi:oligoribonuclease
MANEQPNLIWIDCEMTGLSLEKDVLVEIAVLVTDSDLNVIGEVWTLSSRRAPSSWRE